jgi:hypothetical protein
MKRRTSAVSMFLAASVAAGFTMVASDVRIDTRVDPRIRGAVAAIYDSLDREGIGAEPLIQYALEGTQKRGNPDVILAGVRRWASDLRRARRLLGPNATQFEVNAGAKALRAGVDERKLEQLRDWKSEQRYASALNTMAYIITIGVPADTASTILVNLALQGASEAQLRLLQDDVERDIGAGRPAGLAAVTRALGVLREMEAGSGGDGVVPGTALPSTRGTARPADPMANGTLRGSAVGNKGDVARPPAARGKDNKRPPP